jgi:multidrug efflux pump subunit AcrA (membrane-fusion protein)
MFKLIPLLIALAGILFSLNLVQNQNAPQPLPTLAFEPPAAPYPKSIGARGLVEGSDENIRISPAVAGLVTRVAVKVGDEVRAGDVLLEQDARDAQAQILVQEANVASLQASLKEAEVALADRQDQWRRIEQLGENRVVSVDEKQRTFFALRAAESRVELQRVNLDAAKALLGRAKVQRTLLSVLAPADSTVLQVNIRAGEYAALNSIEIPILLARTQELQLRADVDEDNAPRVRANCEAVAFIKGIKGDALPLRFVRIEPYILPKRSLTGDSSERVDTRVLQVIFRFDRPKTPIYVGQQMDVFLNAE